MSNSKETRHEKFKKSLTGSGFSARAKLSELSDLLYSEIESVKKSVKKNDSKSKGEKVKTETKKSEK